MNHDIGLGAKDAGWQSPLVAMMKQRALKNHRTRMTARPPRRYRQDEESRYHEQSSRGQSAEWQAPGQGKGKSRYHEQGKSRYNEQQEPPVTPPKGHSKGRPPATPPKTPPNPPPSSRMRNPKEKGSRMRNGLGTETEVSGFVILDSGNIFLSFTIGCGDYLFEEEV